MNRIHHVLRLKKYDLDSIPLNYMTSPEVISQIEKATSQLEMAEETQTAVNDLNNEITTIVLNQMEQYIPHRVITVPPRERKGRHSKKPWWNDELSSMWLIVDAAEKTIS